MKKIKVLQVVGSLRRGGLETVSLNLYKYIDRENYEFDYLVYGDEIGELENEVRELGGRILRVSKPGLNFIKFIKSIRKILKTYGPYDIVHSHPLFNSGLVMRACDKENISMTITHAHSDRSSCNVSLIKKLYISFMKFNIRKYSDYIIACSNEAGKYLFGEDEFNKRGVILKNGININKYRYDINIRNEVRNNLNIDNNTIVLGHVGRLTNVKNQEFIIYLLKKLQNTNIKFKLILVGDGEDKLKLMNIAKNIGVYKDVIFLGSRKDVNLLLQCMDIFIFPSKHEGLGLSVIEAQATGLPCIISDRLPYDVDITENIYRLSITDNAHKWIEKIIELTKTNNQRSDKINEVKSHGFDIDSSSSTIFNIYNTTINI